MIGIGLEVEPTLVLPVPIGGDDSTRVPKHVDHLPPREEGEHVVDPEGVARGLLAPQGAAEFPHLDEAEGHEEGIGTATERIGGLAKRMPAHPGLFGIAVMAVRAVGQGEEVVLADLLALLVEFTAQPIRHANPEVIEVMGLRCGVLGLLPEGRSHEIRSGA